MKMAKLLKAMCALGVVAACAGVLAACSSEGGSADGGATGVAATVNGVEIPEEKVTATIESVREQSDLQDEATWAQFLIDNDMTPESVREQIIDSLIDQELIKAGAGTLGLSVDSTEVDTYIDSMKANFDTDEAWAEALEQAGFTEDEYRQNIESSLLQQQLNTHFQDEAEVTDEDVVESANIYAAYYDGAKRSSHILFGVDDTSDEAAMKDAREKAQKILDQIKSGDLDFKEAAKANSTDTGSAENEGDVGWDVLNSFVSEYTEALEELDKDEVSDLVESQYGIHIIKVTDVFNAPDEIKELSDLPEEFQETIKDMAKSTKANEDYTEWLDKQREDADIVKNEMPANVSYNVDLSKYADESADDADEEGDDEEEADVDGEEVEDAEDADEADADEADAEADADADAEEAYAEDAEEADDAEDEAVVVEEADADDDEGEQVEEVELESVDADEAKAAADEASSSAASAASE